MLDFIFKQRISIAFNDLIYINEKINQAIVFILLPQTSIQKERFWKTNP